MSLNYAASGRMREIQVRVDAAALSLNSGSSKLDTRRDPVLWASRTVPSSSADVSLCPHISSWLAEACPHYVK